MAHSPAMTSDTPGVRRLPGARRSTVVPDPIHLNAVPDSIHRNEDVEYHAPVHALRPETFVYDHARNRQILRIQGVVPLPIGGHHALRGRETRRVERVRAIREQLVRITEPIAVGVPGDGTGPVLIDFLAVQKTISVGVVVERIGPVNIDLL